MQLSKGISAKISELTNGKVVFVSVHYRPIQLINAKLGVNIEIPALSREDLQNLKYNTFVLPDIVQEIPRVAQAGTETIIIPAKDLGPSLIRDNVHSIYGATTNTGAVPGIGCFDWVPDFKPTKEDILDLAKKTKRFAQALVFKGDELANTNRLGDISDQHVDAAKFLGVNASWIPRGEVEGISATCQFCSKVINSTAVKCPHCNEVVNPQAYAQLKAAQEAVIANLQESAIIAGKKQVASGR